MRPSLAARAFYREDPSHKPGDRDHPDVVWHAARSHRARSSSYRTAA